LTSPCAIALLLRIRVAPENRARVIEFLRQARPYYEAPGGIHMRLLEDNEDENALIELIEYETLQAYEADEKRVITDPQMKAYLQTWRSLLAEPPKVEIYMDVSSQLDHHQPDLTTEQ
jgi:quinol monooxygenase YgiN